MVAALFVVLAVSSGFGFYGQAIFLSAFIDELGLTNGVAAGATTVMFLASAAAGVVVARSLRTHDARAVIVGGALIVGAAMWALGRVTEVWQLYLAEVVFGIGWSASSLVPVTTIVTRWFVHRRAMAIAVVSSGLSLGGVVLTPLAAWLLDARGLAGGMPLLGLAFVAGIVPITLAVVRDDPARVGLAPEGAGAVGEQPGSQGSPAGAALSVAAAVRSSFFVWSTLAYLLIMLAQGGGIGHLFELAGERTDDATAAAAVSILAGTSVVARLVGGWLATRRSVRALTIGLCGVQCASLVLLSQASGRTALVAGAVAFGVTVGNLPVLQPLLVIEAFGVERYADIYARAQVPTTVGLAIGPVVLGLVHDATDGYAGSYLLAAAAAAGAGVLMATLAGPTAAAGGEVSGAA